MSHESDPKNAAAATPLAGIPSIDEHGDEQMTSKQADELRALCDAHGKMFDQTLSRDAAAAMIAELRDEEGIVPPQS